VDIGGDDPHCVIVVGDRQQVVQIDAVECRPSEMTRHEKWIELGHERAKAREMTSIEACRRTY
jgi:hypothetical protein